MKKPLLSFLAFAVISTASTQAQLYYSTLSNAGWGDSSAWNSTATTDPGTTGWVDNSVAVFGNYTSATSVVNSANRTLAGLTRTGGNATLTIQGSGSNLVFNGGTISVSGSQLSIQGGLTGDFTKMGNNTLLLAVTGAAPYVGTATVSEGRVNFGAPTRSNTNSNAILNGGILGMGNNVTPYTFGSVSGSSGTFDVMQNATGAGQATVSISSLSSTGDGFTVTSLGSNNSNATSNNPNLIVNQSGDTIFTGPIIGAVTNTGNASTRTRLSFTKNGTGDLTLTGNLTNFERTTEINGGRLVVNSTTTSFGHFNGTTAISVNNGGTLGGTGTISILAGDHVIVQDGGRLEAGLDGMAGLITYMLDSTSSLDLSNATAGFATGWLRFDLGASTSPGLTYDQIALTGGTLNIGTGLTFADFAFNSLAGFGGGTYTLFSGADALAGTLGGSVTGDINGLSSTLSISGSNLILTVVPEPATWVLLSLGLFPLLLRRHRRL